MNSIRKGVQLTSQELLFNSDSFGDNQFNSVRMGTALEMAKWQAGEVGVHSFVTTNEFVGEGEAGAR